MTDAPVAQKLEKDGLHEDQRPEGREGRHLDGQGHHNGKEVSVNVDQTRVVTAK
jgi:hypothetical protein